MAVVHVPAAAAAVVVCCVKPTERVLTGKLVIFKQIFNALFVLRSCLFARHPLRFFASCLGLLKQRSS
jgi:hypothetical protein